jgi:hypothetical protein
VSDAGGSRRAHSWPTRPGERWVSRVKCQGLLGRVRSTLKLNPKACHLTVRVPGITRFRVLFDQLSIKVRKSVKCPNLGTDLQVSHSGLELHARGKRPKSKQGQNRLRTKRLAARETILYRLVVCCCGIPQQRKNVRGQHCRDNSVFDVYIHEHGQETGPSCYSDFVACRERECCLLVLNLVSSTLNISALRRCVCREARGLTLYSLPMVGLLCAY